MKATTHGLQLNNWLAKRFLTGEGDGKPCVATHGSIRYTYLYVCAICSYTGEYVEELMDST